MSYRGWIKRPVSLGASVFCLGFTVGCENPELVYVELPNQPGESNDAGTHTNVDEVTTAALVGEASTGATIKPPQTTNIDASDPSSDTDESVKDATATSLDSSVTTMQSDASAPNASASNTSATSGAAGGSETQGATDSSSSPRGDAETSASDARSDDDADADDDASIICDCPDEVNPCLKALCLAGVTICTFTPSPGNECDDGNPCTQSDTCDDSGECIGTAKDCSDEDGVCVEGVCNEDSGECEAKPSAKNTECDDDDRCSLDDVCDGKGVCKGKPRDCSDLDSSCTEGTCDQASGACVAVPTNVGDSCDDADKCTADDVCDEDGKCGGQAVDCSEASTACAVGECDAKDGACKPKPLSGIACDDGDACTTLDTCDEGECKGQEADDCGDAGWLDFASGSASVIMSNECASDDFDVRSQVPEDSDCDRSSGDDVVFMLDLSEFDDPVTVRASTSNDATEFDTVLFLMAQECSDEAVIACVDDSDDDGFGSTLEVRVEPGVYALVVDSYRGNEAGLFQLDVVLDQ